MFIRSLVHSPCFRSAHFWPSANLVSLTLSIHPYTYEFGHTCTTSYTQTHIAAVHTHARARAPVSQLQNKKLDGYFVEFRIKTLSCFCSAFLVRTSPPYAHWSWAQNYSFIVTTCACALGMSAYACVLVSVGTTYVDARTRARSFAYMSHESKIRLPHFTLPA